MKLLHNLAGITRWMIDAIGRTPIFSCRNYMYKGQIYSSKHVISESEVVWKSSDNPLNQYYDHIEMTGHKVSMIVNYGVTHKRKLKMFRHIVFPLLRTIPNDTFGSFTANFKKASSPQVQIDGKRIKSSRVTEIRFDGILRIIEETDEKLTIIHSLFPTVNFQAGVEKITICNNDSISHLVKVTSPRFQRLSNQQKGVDGSYRISAHLADSDNIFHSSKAEDISFTLGPNQSVDVYQVFCATKKNEILTFDVSLEEAERIKFLNEMQSSLILETPDEELNVMFRYAKVRAAESIIQTKNGWMHNPGGGTYYAALWTNDQCEYANPLFPFLGYDIANEAAINCYRLFMKQMDPTYKLPLVSSIIAEGDGTWNGAGDRGDAAMFAYGAARFCLAYGDFEIARELWPGIEWAINYSLKKKNHDGVIESDSDELENRFESGDANLFTSSLLYDALKSAVDLGKELKISDTILSRYTENRRELRSAIETYFGHEVEGYQTYQYYQGNKHLRAWICIPLAMEIYDRAEGTVAALCSSRLWTKDGLRTESGKKTFWDRSTLYALRAFFQSGFPEVGLERLKAYSRERLLGKHVPYSVEAFPEGNQKHLSAESALYIRIYTEGILGLRVTGFNQFTLNIQMPKEWDYMSFKNIKLFQRTFNLDVARSGNLIKIEISDKKGIMIQTSSNGRFEVNLNTINNDNLSFGRSK